MIVESSHKKGVGSGGDESGGTPHETGGRLEPNTVASLSVDPNW